jgi:hypothetical protein
VIARNALLLSLLLGAVVLTPLAADKRSSFGREPEPAAMTSEDHREHFQFERYLVDKGKDPLAWDCKRTVSDRIRYFRDSCLAQHLVEIELGQPGQGANVQLSASGDGVFAAGGRTLTHRWYEIGSDQGNALRSVAVSTLPKLQQDPIRWAFPRHLAAIEACIGGESFLAIRSRGGEPAFEEAARQIAFHGEYREGRTSPANCM